MRRKIFVYRSIFWLCLLPIFAGSAFAADNGPDEERDSNQSVSQRTTEALDPQLKRVVDEMAAAGVLNPSTVERVRGAYPVYAKLAGPPEPVYHVEDRRIPGPAGEIPIRLYFPGTRAVYPVWVFFHGGGFVSGSLETHDSPLRAITNRCDCLVVSVGYRLAPEYPYPAAPEDSYAATKWVADHASEIGGDPSRIAVGGDGAGGNLAAVVSLMARERRGPDLVYQVLIYPILDALMTSYSWVESDDPILTRDSMVARWSVYVPVNVDQENPYISPATAKNFAKLPPTLIITGMRDPVSDTARQYASELKREGIPTQLVRYEHVIHCFFLMAAALDDGKKSIEETADALKRRFADLEPE